MLFEDVTSGKDGTVRILLGDNVGADVVVALPTAEVADTKSHSSTVGSGTVVVTTAGAVIVIGAVTDIAAGAALKSVNSSSSSVTDGMAGAWVD